MSIILYKSEIPDNNTINSIIKISDKNFSQGYCDENYILSYVKDNKSFILIYMKNDVILGYCICTEWGKNDLFKYCNNNKNLIENFNHSNHSKYGVIKTLAVDPKNQKTGIGSKLFLEAENILLKNKLKYFIVPSWVYGGIINIQNICENYGYSEWFLIDDYWHNICSNFSCPKKINKKCICGMLCYIKISN